MNPNKRFVSNQGNQLSRVGPSFEPARLTTARELRALTKTVLAERIATEPSRVARFESGTERPDIACLSRLALALHVPLSFLTRPLRVRPIGGESCHFRHLRAGDQVERRRQLATAALLCEVLDFIDEHVHLPREG